jgi:DNA (cytosine-5)-methyltransferase 1
MKYLSLFSGIGGFELGIQKAYEELYNLRPNELADSKRPKELHITSDKQLKWECVGYSEIDKYAIQIYQSHFPEHKNYGNAATINASELPDFDLLVGGFPCQAFSIAGKRRGFDDTRGTLFFDIARILKEKRPRNFILENVKGLLSHNGGATFKTIITTLTELGYCVEWQVLNAKNFGVPQNRERVFIVGHFGGIPERKVFPITDNGGKDIKQLLGGSQSERVYSRKGISSTLSTMQGGNLQPKVFEEKRIRRLTPLECERLMSYPDGWTEKGTEGKISDTQRYKTLGNGICSCVVQEVVKRLF